MFFVPPNQRFVGFVASLFIFLVGFSKKKNLILYIET